MTERKFEIIMLNHIFSPVGEYTLLMRKAGAIHGR
jgi:hypothetical protein